MITSGKNLREDERCRSGSQNLIGSPDVEIDESDEERELTNLNWLLRNQSVTWPKIMDGNSEDDLNTSVSLLGNQIAQNRKSNLSDLNISHSRTPNKKTISPNLVSGTESRKQCSTTSAEVPSKRLSPAERFDIFINKIKRDLAEYEKSEIKYKTDVTEKPPFNYSHIIGMAMLENGRVTLQQICAWIESKFAFFRARKKWNNSIRHNLSLHHCFRNRKREEKGKGGYWELGVDPKKCDRKRIRNRKSGQSKSTSTQAKNHGPMRELEISTRSLETDKIEDEEEGDDQASYQYEQLSQSNHYVDAVRGAQLVLGQKPLEVELGHGLSRIQGTDNTFLCPSELTLFTEELQPQYELGTIIISTTGIIDESSACLNSIINNKFSCANMIYTEDEIPMSNENVIISSHMSTILDSANRDTDIALVTPVVPSPEFPISCEYANFRAYIDGVDESLNFLHSAEINRNEDILDNLLDVCVRDY